MILGRVGAGLAELTSILLLIVIGKAPATDPSTFATPVTHPSKKRPYDAPSAPGPHKKQRTVEDKEEEGTDDGDGEDDEVVEEDDELEEGEEPRARVTVTVNEIKENILSIAKKDPTQVREKSVSMTY